MAGTAARASGRSTRASRGLPGARLVEDLGEALCNTPQSRQTADQLCMVSRQEPRLIHSSSFDSMRFQRLHRRALNDLPHRSSATRGIGQSQLWFCSTETWCRRCCGTSDRSQRAGLFCATARLRALFSHDGAVARSERLGAGGRRSAAGRRRRVRGRPVAGQEALERSLRLDPPASYSSAQDSSRHEDAVARSTAPVPPVMPHLLKPVAVKTCADVRRNRPMYGTRSTDM